MNISEIRLKNARQLADSIGGVVAMAEKLGKSQPQVSHLIGDKPVKNIGNKIARQIEEAFNKEQGWLDNTHTDTTSDITDTDKANALQKTPLNDFSEIPIALMAGDEFCNYLYSTKKKEYEQMFIKLDFEISSNAFAVLIGEDGCGEFAVPDDYIIFDPDEQMKSKDYVLVQFGEQAPAIMEYIKVADNAFFEDLSRRYPPVQITDELEFTIHGVAVYKGHKGTRLR